MFNVSNVSIVFKKIAVLMAAGVFAASLSTVALAQKDHVKGAKMEKKAAAGPKCPVCHMALAEKKSAKNPVAVKIGKKTYYCCSACKMHMDKASHAKK